MNFRGLCGTALIAAGAEGPAAVFAAEGPLGFTVEAGPTVEITRSHGRCWFPSVHRFRSGVLLVTMSLSPDERNAEGAEGAYCLSRDGGATWSRRQTLGAQVEGGAWLESPDRDDVLWRWGDFPEACREGDATRFYSSQVRFSRDGRAVSVDYDRTLTVAHPVYYTPVAIYPYHFDGKSAVADSRIVSEPCLRATGDIVFGPDGILYCCGYYIRADATRYGDPRAHFQCILLRSTDGGMSWSEYSTIAEAPGSGRPAWMGREGPNEIALALLSDRRLYAVYRTGSGGMMGNSWSSDGGKTWTPPASIGFVGVKPCLRRLADGMLVMVTGRPGPVALRFNFDGTGRTWSEPKEIFAGSSTRYAEFVEVSAGRLFVVYDSVPYGWHDIPPPDRDARNAILGTFVNLKGK